MNRKIAASLVSTGIMMSLVVGATFAYFSNSGTSSDNSFSTGTLDLKLTDSNETAQDTVTASLGGTLAPGECTGVQTLSVKNTGTVNADHLQVTVANTITDTSNNASPDMDSYLRINSLAYDSSSVVGQIAGSNGNGYADLEDWAADVDGIDNLALTDLNTNHTLSIDVCLDDSAPNSIQEDSVSTTVNVLLNQHSSQ
jgi:predicted ribosomally synthesized peptide with SipW-like signal peptide